MNERRNIRTLLISLKDTLQRMGITWQLVVVDGGSTDGTPDEARSQGAAVIIQKERGYGRALIEGFRVGQGRYILTMDADLSHPAEFVEELWRQRERGDLLVASRYVPGARFEAPLFRKILSRILNFVFWRVLSLPVKDVSSGFRLYHAEALQGLTVEGRNFEVLEELLIRIFMNGWTVSEIPFHYAPRRDGTSKAHLFSFGLCLWTTLMKMRRLRNSGPTGKK